MATVAGMADLPTIRTALDTCYTAIDALGADLAPEEWSTQSLCPDWDVRGVISHLAAIEAILQGWLPDGPDTPPPFERAGAFAEATASLDGPGFAATAHELFEARRAELAALSEADFARPSWTPIGPGTLGRFLTVRVFDFWVHERDITTPLGRTTDDSGLTAELSVDEVAGSLGYIVGKKIGLPDGKSIGFHLTGPVARDLYAVVDGRAKAVEHVDAPDVEVTADSLTFVQLACGRIDPQGAIDAGRIRWTGDAELGDRAARNLRFTM